MHARDRWILKTAERATRAWVRLYTRGLPERVRVERLDEIESDFWEEAQGPVGRRSERGSGMFARTLQGALSDLVWRREEREYLAAGVRTVSAPRLGRTRPNRPRGPGLAFTVLAVLMTTVVAGLALTSRQTPPPTIAEFAPQAVEHIAESSGGTAEGRGRSPSEVSASAEAAHLADPPPQSIDVARVRQCVGDPPRQIEDPQSPPCVPYWSGDNGGATSHGVTRDEVRVVHPANRDAVLAAFFNRRFEFYGRQLRLINRPVPPADAAGARAMARAVRDEDRAFASTGGWQTDVSYFEELARLGVVGVHNMPLFPETYLTARRPYLWTYTMANDQLFATAGDWYCARLATRNAAHAGDPVLQQSRRKPGIILTSADWEGTSAEPMNARFASCGGRTDAVVQSSHRHSWGNGQEYAYYAAFMENAMLQMKTAGVTTVAFLGDWVLVGSAMVAASNQGFFPEWQVTTYLANDTSANVKAYAPPQQSKSLMLLLPHPMERVYGDRPSNWARQEAANTGSPANANSQWSLDFNYRMLLLLASGIQMAGPYLTPETLERGLHQARFPNPPHRIMAGAVGFSGADHSMTDDAVEAWWSNTAQSPDSAGGAFCYLEGGARRRIGTFPRDDPFFKGPCESGR